MQHDFVTMQASIMRRLCFVSLFAWISLDACYSTVVLLRRRRHSSMTVDHCRIINLLLWMVLMGLQPVSKPDDDLLLQAALTLNEFYIRMRCISMPYTAGRRDNESLDNIQQLGFEEGPCIEKALDVNITTKTH